MRQQCDALVFPLGHLVSTPLGQRRPEGPHLNAATLLT
ncbi:hypothetical protein BQ8420_27640 [Nocardiopsis sp. JB363]|nr:hypothetical protein BQ8420_27640 [Nocardiopsis sp. JB363]